MVTLCLPSLDKADLVPCKKPDRYDLGSSKSKVLNSLIVIVTLYLPSFDKADLVPCKKPDRYDLGSSKSK